MKRLPGNKWIWVLVLVGMGGVIVRFVYQNRELTKVRIGLEQELNNTQHILTSTKADLLSATDRLKELGGELSQTRQDRDTAKQHFADAAQQVNSLAGEVSKVTGAVGIIQKTNSVDPQLLQKYSKVYFLNENYVPSKLVEIDVSHKFDPERELEVHASIWSFLKSMMDDASAGGVDLQVLSGYRSFGVQGELKSSYNVTYGTGTANQFSADQGYSDFRQIKDILNTSWAQRWI